MIAAFALVVASLLGPCWQPPVRAPVSQPFSAPGCRWCPGHQALGYRVAPGTPVTAVAPGTVVFAGRVAGVVYVAVRHADGVRATYGGLRGVSVRAGQAVILGQSVGEAAAVVTFSARRGGVYLDPTPLLGRWRTRPRLVPTDGTRPRAPDRARLECPASVGSR